jgi:hypothetical protein
VLVNIPARIALFRAYLAEFHSDADATAAFASRALALIGQDGPDVRLLTSIGSLVAGAMHQARLHRQLAAREQAAERFAEQVIAARRSPNGAGWPRTSMTRSRSGW